jgi:uncharacterized protein YggU (UPF0235/DUF167 family)
MTRAGRPHARAHNHHMESCEIAVRLIPRARAEEVGGERNGALLVRVTAAPVDGRANAALCRVLARRLGVGMRSVSVVRGTTSREKLVRIDGMSIQKARRLLSAKPASATPR